MKRLRQILLLAVLAVVLVALLGPFLVPIRPPAGTVPPEQLADPDSQFVDIDGLTVHYKTEGQGQPALVLLHGFASSTFTWREVMAPLANRGAVIAFDRPAFGLTERPMPGEWQGDSPYSVEAQADQTVALLDKLGIDRAVLVGNSAGGTVAMVVALRHPERVQALVLVDPAIYSGGGAPAWVRPLLKIPQIRRLGPLFARSIERFGDRLVRTAWHDPGRLTPEITAGYRKPLRAENWDRALWELTLASRPLGLEQRLGEVTMPVLVVTGDDDRIVPTADSVRLAGELPGAQLTIITECGHVPQEECPEEFLKAVDAFLNDLSPASETQ